MTKIIRKFNIIDILIISVLLLGIFALFYKFSIKSDDNTHTFHLTYICKSAPSELVDGIQEYQDCTDADLGAELGKVLWVSTSESLENPSFKSAVICTTVSAKDAEHGTEIDNSIYLKGKKVNLIIEDSVFETYLSDIKKIQED